MRRRTLLATLALSPIPGCVSPGDDPSTTDSTSPTATTTPPEQSTTAVTSTPQDTPTPTVTPAPDDPILFIVDNGTDGEQTVTLTITRDEATVLDETTTLAAGESVEYDPMIGATGEYAITVAVDGGPTRTIDRNIGRFDVRNGSNHFVDITAEEIRIYWEE
ncbi:hypothetical protein SAMN05443574_106156 [Haloarcula vallismortis]|uniref:Ig-like domain-containing protein n=2 Tax=Haloarcula vallismortis TaxID=28442 RepID=M0JI25_HALVA|nr:hypothetical protein [Haloarcula vallismortis]EMA07649.1 hypothetical protein C437_09403 [Haloarcula vallismortis ATCC 29715]SDW75082.1 hypothetical protein SAMN05443574_106156 [Haloarcula vallismortis]